MLLGWKKYNRELKGKEGEEEIGIGARGGMEAKGKKKLVERKIGKEREEKEKKRKREG